MTEAIIVGVLVGAFSGIVGSVAGPYLSHSLDRRRRAELRREERRRESKEMLEAMMRLARTAQSGLSEYQLAYTLGRDLNEVRLTQLHYVLDLQARYPNFFWRPQRIEDGRLRQAAQELQDANTRANLLMFDRLTLALERLAQWDTDANEAKAQIDREIDAVDARLDELGW